jgi:hypothetical protein
MATFILGVIDWFFKISFFQPFMIDHQATRFPSQNFYGGACTVHENKHISTQWIP